jgi:CubicO group peptidase (beta-lactamase class C family)
MNFVAPRRKPQHQQLKKGHMKKHLVVGLSLCAGAVWSYEAVADPIITFKPQDKTIFLIEGKVETLVWRDKSESENLKAITDAQQKGFWVQSVGAYGAKAKERFVTVMAKQLGTAAPMQQVVMRDVSAANLTSVPAGWRATKVAASGDRAIVVLELGSDSTVLFRANSADELGQECSKQIRLDRRLVSLDGYGDPTAPKFLAVFANNPAKVAWNADVLNMTVGEAQTRFDVMTKARARVSVLGYAAPSRFFHVYSDDDFGSWEARGELTPEKLDVEIAKQKTLGRVPISIQAVGIQDIRFAAIFAERIKPQPLKFQAQGETSIPEIDNAVRQMMENNSMRHVSLAVTLGTRLVYVRAYTLGTPGDAPTTPATLFRQASVNKPFVAAAIYRLVNMKAKIPGTNGVLTLDTTLQKVLNLQTPDGKKPKDSRFGDVTLRHLIAHKSGLTTGGIWSDVATAKAFNTMLPVSPEQVASYIASLDMDSAPSMTAPVVYNNTNTFFLGLVAAKMTGKPDAFSALKQLIYDPLGMKNVAMSRTSIEKQLPNEVFYQPRLSFTETADPNSQRRNTYLCFSNDVTKDGAPLSVLGYGETNMENCIAPGGTSMSAIDAVRLAAALAAPNGGGIFTEDGRKQFLTDATSDGRYSFDGTFLAAPDRWVGWKGGSLSTSGNTLYCDTGGVSFSISGATAGYTGPNFYPTNQDLINAINARKWDGVDLFPKYGYKPIPTLGPLKLDGKIPTLPKSNITLKDSDVSGALNLAPGNSSKNPNLRTPGLNSQNRPRRPRPILRRPNQ